MSDQNIEIDVDKLIEQIEENDMVSETADGMTMEKYIYDFDDQPVVIDRDQENSDVETFQKTGDLDILERVYKNRIPTLKGWAIKHYYPGLTSSVEDLFEELSVVFVKAAKTYNGDKGQFNTWLWTLLINRLKNIKNSKHAKKRISEHYDGPLSGMLLSLDYSYSDCDGAEVTLKDIIASNPSDHHGDTVTEETSFEETVRILAKDNEVFEDALRKIGEGNSVASLVRDYKRRKGYIKVTPAEATRFRKNKCKRMVADLLANKKVCQTFKLIGYEVVGTKLYYEIEMKKSPEADLVMKTIRDLRNNKDVYIRQIRGRHQ